MTMLHFASLILALQIAPLTSLHGVVVNAATKEPIARASIALINVNGSPNDARIVVSGNEGQFSIPSLPAGRYSVVVTRAGYIRFVYGQRAPNEPAGIIEVRDGQRLEDIRVEMIPTGVISGRVFSPEGERQGDVTVRALRATYRDGRRSMSIVKEVQTNDLGEYRLAGLTPGRYFVSVSSPPPARIEGERFFQPTAARSDGTPAGTASTSLQNAINSGRVDPSVIAGELYPEVYFPGTLDPSAAASVNLRAGETSSGIDLSITRVSQVYIRGRIVNDTGLNGAVRSIGLSTRGTQSRFGGRTTNVSNNGSFEFTSLIPGSYILNAFMENPASLLSSAAEVTTGNSGIENVQLILHKPLTLSGRVKIEGRLQSDNDPSVSRLRLTLNSQFNPGGLIADVKPDGTFAFTGTSGLVPNESYQLRFIELIPQKNYYLKTAQLGPMDVLSSSLQLDRETNAQLEVVLSSNSATLDCTVIDEHEHEAAKTLVVLVPDPAHRQSSDFYKTGTTDGQGRVRIEGITPGDYKLFAWSDIEQGSWEDSETIRLYESKGEPVHFDEGTNLRKTVRQLN
jgi:Carboxypeptidase regulatory-like domain